MRLSLVTPPAIEPITLAEAKVHLQIGTGVTDEDDYIEDTLIPSSRERGEQATLRQWITGTWDYKLRRFPCGAVIVLPRAPLLTVTSITYVDQNGTSQTLASSNYTVRPYVGPKAPRGHVELGFGLTWPTTRDQLDAVTVRFTAGYGATAVSVPSRLRRAMLTDIGSMYYAGRQDQVIGRITSELARPATAHGIYWDFRSHPEPTCPTCGDVCLKAA
jgi:uncharacterized phiE125 gp8 family phage protein